MATGPTLHSFDVEHQNVVLRGPFGSMYSVSTSAADLAPFEHGMVMREVGGEKRIGVVLGVLSGNVWLYFKKGQVAVAIRMIDAPTLLERAPLSAFGDVEFIGPLGVSYRFDSQELDDVFDVRAGSQHYLKIWKSKVSFIGVFLGVPWVHVLEGGFPTQGDCAMPLAGCKDGDVLRSLFGLCEVPVSNGGLLVESPRTKSTPRAAAFKVIEMGKRAICQAPMGVVLPADISDDALKAFDLHHGDRLLVLHGAGNGKLATVIGVTSGTLVVFIDGDAKVTIVRGCSSAADVSSHFARPKGTAVNRATSVQQHSPVASRTKQGGVVTPKVSKKTFHCWTAFGRYEFDASEDAIRRFGPYNHEQTVRATRGADRGALFHVVGVRSGVLWVLGENKMRAVPLAHCTDKSSIDNRYGFVACGRTSLKEHGDRNDEPPPTPFNSPQGRARSIEPAEDTPQCRIESVEKPKLVTVPPIAGLQLARQLAPALEAVSDRLQSEAVIESNASSPAVMGGSGQSARNYLKAVAMFMLGTTNQNRNPLPFHEYYTVDPTRRLGAALRKLDGTKEAWRNMHPSKPFTDATVEDILRLFAKFPQLLP